MTYGAFFGGGEGGGGEPALPVNLDTTYRLLGFDAGNGTLVTGANNNLKGAWTTIEAETDAALAGFWLSPAYASGINLRALVDISFDGGATIAIPNLFIWPGSVTSGMTGPFWFPVNIPAGAHVAIRMQGAQAWGTMRFAVIGEVRTANSRPLFNHCEHLVAPATATTQPSDVGLPLSGEWAEINAATAREYGALWAAYGVQGTPTGQPVGLFIGKGAEGAEAALAGVISAVNSSSPTLRGGASIPINQVIAAGTRVVARAYGATVGGSDGVCAQVLGFYN
ncbi:hypothetical protein [Phenylobacterium sp. 58.2.17]|uniref:hypothetical protein n=1 Tax=Phenylobacterium sp. 58.2.17 TaxID=2969306 RepID=UPI0022644D43|nr:hypothetical protein [Phenylobacterium sp. 58.2.17]MCX7586528.1 hypothetical protein [Phenylobacterium sp. 58.2.17]